jgi:membrane protein YdbS with pleckstrin-like domain
MADQTNLGPDSQRAEQPSSALQAGAAVPTAYKPTQRELDEVLRPESERDLWAGRASPRCFVGPWVLWLVLMILILWFVSWLHARWPATPRTLVVGMIVVLSAGFLAVKMAAFILSRRFRLTTQRLFIEQGVFGRTTNQVDLVRVNDVAVAQSFFERLLDVGDVKIECPTDVSDPRIVIRGVLAPNQVAEHVHRQMQIIRNRKTVMMEAT